jgi:hypothetical protein
MMVWDAKKYQKADRCFLSYVLLISVQRALLKGENQGNRVTIFKGISWICKQNNISLGEPNGWMKIRVIRDNGNIDANWGCGDVCGQLKKRHCG